jgi:hypothetical protein
MQVNQFAYAPAEEARSNVPLRVPLSVRIHAHSALPERAHTWGIFQGQIIEHICQRLTFIHFSSDKELASAADAALADDRLADLREAADDEGIAYRDAAENDVREFLALAGAQVRPALYLLDDGSLRAKWTNLNGEQIALQFRGDRYAHHIFFVQRASGEITKVMGRDTLEGALSQIRTLGLLSLLRA